MRPRLVKQRPYESTRIKWHRARHRGEPRNACTPHQLQQYGLELIVLVMRREQPLVAA
jgi:hypothetical protein